MNYRKNINRSYLKLYIVFYIKIQKAEVYETYYYKLEIASALNA